MADSGEAREAVSSGTLVEEPDGVMEEVDDSDADSESSSDSSDIDEQELNKEIEAEEAVLEANPYLYDQHLLLIEKLKKIADLERLRKARERMSEIFPLTESESFLKEKEKKLFENCMAYALWLSWIRDEMQLAVTDDEKDSVAALFERAVKDYLSVEVWLEYAQFSIGRMGSEGGIERCRDVFERAIIAAGLHVAKGSILWEAYREFENAILGTMKQPSGSSDADEPEKAYAAQKEKVASLFRRQLTVPLIDMEKTFEELQDWLSPEEPDRNIKLTYNKALAKLKKIYPYEEMLFSVESSSESAFVDYISFELKEGEPTQILCLYERAIVDHCLSANLWEKYTHYLDTQLKVDTVVLSVYERSVRNCPWIVTLWQGYLRALERYNMPREKIKGVAERALTAGIVSADDFRRLWLTYLEYLHRHIDWDKDHAEHLELLRATFKKAHNHLVDGFGFDGDPNCTVLQYWARIEASHCKNMIKAREIWNDILQLGHMHHAHMWLEFGNLERTHGDSKHLRKLFERALQAASDWPESVGEVWVNFERDEGTLEHLETALRKIEARMKVIQERRLKVQDVKQNAVNEQTDTTKQGSGAVRSKTSKGSAVPHGTSKPKKRKLEESGNCNPQLDDEGFKIPQALPVLSRNAGSAGMDLEAPKRSKAELGATSLKRGESVHHDPAKDEHSVFLSNLSYDVDESVIKGFFSEVGEVKDVRLVRDYKGRSKGFCYVEFADWTMANKALQKDRDLIDGRPVFVSKCESKDKRTRAKFKYSLGEEKNKLFVKGLPFSVTQTELADMFKPFGKLKEVRLVTFHSGKSKGCAYVEYADIESAAVAVGKMDGTTLGAHTVSVAISKPPDRQAKGAAVNTVGRSLGGGTMGSRPRGHSRTQLSLLPRALMKSQETSKTSLASNGGVESSKPMSNSDFRNMLLSKK